MLRKCVTLGSVVAVLALSGCSLPGDKVRCGWEFRVVKPPVINTEMPVIIQHDSGPIQAQPVGTVAGPVQEGAFKHAAKPAPLLMQAAPIYRQDVTGCLPMPAPAVRTMTCEEWCQMMHALKGRAMPPANE